MPHHIWFLPAILMFRRTQNIRFTSIGPALKAACTRQNGKIWSLSEAVGVAVWLARCRVSRQSGPPEAPPTGPLCCILMAQNTVLLKKKTGERSRGRKVFSLSLISGMSDKSWEIRSDFSYSPNTKVNRDSVSESSVPGESCLLPPSQLQKLQYLRYYGN